MGQGAALGERIRTYGVVLLGHLTEAQWKTLLVAVCDAIGMYPVGEPKVWTYPLEGKGGTGQTIMLPITESFLVVDTWSDHGGAYLFVCSCREFSIGKVLDTAEEHGLEVRKDLDGQFFHQLRLK